MTIEQIAASLLVWIASHSSYPAAQLPVPPIVQMAPGQLRELVIERTSARGSANAFGYFSLDDADRGTVYVTRATDTPGADTYTDATDNPIWRERLLHELVHYAQHATGAADALKCPSKRELPAYHLGGLYLNQRNVPDPLPDRLQIAFMMGPC